MLSTYYQVNISAMFYLLVILQLCSAIILLVACSSQLRSTRAPVIEVGLTDRDLPPLTVCIPARNETLDLEACLNSLIASNYPKLEILVLDDWSQNKHTPEIIRNFAHAGVRFIAGKEPPSHWLAKNYAYSQLAEAANGEILLFCGVDTRFRPDSLSNIVKIMIQNKKSMLSILPHNLLPKVNNLGSVVIQPSRYAWELALPRGLLGRPPVLSTCWVITRQALGDYGGFPAVSHQVVPESYFAKHVGSRSDGYSFLQSDNAAAVSNQKSFAEQRYTAVRTRYPQLHRRPELVALVGLAEFCLLLGPYIIFVAAFLINNWLLAGLSGSAVLLNIIWYARVVNLTYRRNNFWGLLALPLAALYDIGLLNYSMWRYEFNEVIWKGRNVCIPLMQTVPHLPYGDAKKRPSS